MVQRIDQGGMTRDQARAARKDETEAAPRPQPFTFDFQSDDGAYRLKLQFRKSHVSDEELAAALRAVLRRIESGSISSSAA